MPTDHPDGTRPIVISRADIQTPIDVQHQTMNLKTNFKEQEVGVHTEAEFETKQDKDKNLECYGTPFDDATLTMVIDYEVPGGKTLYLCQWGANVQASAGIIGIVLEMAGVDLTMKACGGGTPGFATVFVRPIVFVSGHRIYIEIAQYSGGSATCNVFAMGYEL